MVALDLLTYAPFLVHVILVAGEREAGLEGEPAIGDLTLEVQPEDLGARGDLLTIVIDPIVVARVVGDTVLRLVLVVREDVEQTGVEAFDEDIDLCTAEGEVHVVAQAKGVGDLRTKVLSIGHTLCFTTYDPDVKVFVKDLRCTEALGIGSADVDILRGVVAQGSTGAEDSLLDGGVLIETRAEQDAPAVVLPFDLGELAGVAYDLTQGRGEGDGVSAEVEAIADGLLGLPFSQRHLVLEAVIAIFSTSEELSRHEEEVVEVIGVLCTTDPRHPTGDTEVLPVVRGVDGATDRACIHSLALVGSLVAILIDVLVAGFVAELRLTDTTVVAVTGDVLSGTVELEVVLVVFAVAVELQVPAIYGVANGLSYTGYLLGPVDVVTTATGFAKGMDFAGQTGVVRGAEVATEAERAGVKTTKLAVAIAIDVVLLAVASLCEDHGASTVVIADE